MQFINVAKNAVNNHRTDSFLVVTTMFLPLLGGHENICGFVVVLEIILPLVLLLYVITFLYNDVSDGDDVHL